MRMSATITEETLTWLRDKRVFFERNLAGSRLRIGSKLSFDTNSPPEPYTTFLGGSTISGMSAFSYSWSQLPENMRIGRYCSIAVGLTMPAPNHPVDRISTSTFTYSPAGLSCFSAFIEDSGRKFSNIHAAPQKPLPVIGNDVWIGMNVALMPGVTVGDGAVIAANSVVVKDVLPYEIVGGNPARHIRFRFEPELREELLSLKWWRFAFTDFEELDTRQPIRFLDQLRSRIGSIAEYNPERVDLAQMPGVA